MEEKKLLTLPEYHQLILDQRERHHQEMMEVWNGIRYSLNDLVKALIIRNVNK
jgi:hypothetical protein